jgi:hypothetical protein
MQIFRIHLKRPRGPLEYSCSSETVATEQRGK